MILSPKPQLIPQPQAPYPGTSPQPQLKLFPEWITAIKEIYALLDHALLVLVKGGFL
jgi:hypothetical protein